MILNKLFIFSLFFLFSAFLSAMELNLDGQDLPPTPDSTSCSNPISEDSIKIGKAVIKIAKDEKTELSADELALEKSFFVNGSAMRVNTINNFGSMTDDNQDSHLCYSIWSYAKKNEINYILDIGCGLGHASLSHLRNEKNVVVFNDLSTQHLNIIKHRIEITEWFLGTAYINNQRFPEETEFNNDVFTAIWMSYVGHYLSPEELTEGFKKLYNWLTPGGKLFYRVLMPESTAFYSMANDYEKRKNEGNEWPGFVKKADCPDFKDGFGDRDFVHPHTEFELNRLAKEVGFKVKWTRKYFHYKEYGTMSGTLEIIFKKPVPKI